MYRGRIIKAVGGLYTVLYELDGEDIVRLCPARGIFRKEDGTTPLVGDVVDIAPDPNDAEKGSVAYIHHRRNALIRPAIANLDCLFIVIAPAEPPPSLTTVDKLTCIARHNGIEPYIVINKADIADSAELRRIYELSGFVVFCVSARERDGLEAVSHKLEGVTAAFAGASGVGKSSLLNALFPEFDLRTNEVSEKLGRGRHTTKDVRLFKHPGGGFIADTPGFTMLDFTRFDFLEVGELADSFDDFAPYMGLCRYKKCTHTKEEGCALIAAVEDGRVAPTRHDSYCRLYEELKKKKPWEKKT